MTRNPYEWKVLYRAAMLESNGASVWEKIQSAESALRERLEVLPDSLSSRSERTELESALKYLNMLRDNFSGDFDVGL